MIDSNSIRVRFAPSPTGYLHVGGARTALFNWLYARRNGGRFIIRIEDTDIDRNIPGAEEKLLSDLRWLGVHWDEGPDVGGPAGPYRQSERRDLYDAAAKHLLDSGQAYYAFDTAEELTAKRKEAESRGTVFKYQRPDRLPTAADAEKARAEGRPVVVRFKVPDEPITVQDEILGDVTFAAGELEDLVIVKSNGWPTYHFAVVVDDQHMQISHVLRAQEHLMNTPKHVFMFRALGYRVPKFAHLPLVFNIDGTKMSKRDKHKAVRTAVKDRIKQGKWTEGDLAGAAKATADAVKRWLDKVDGEFDSAQLSAVATAVGAVVPEIDVHDFRAAGYLPEALLNFVALIGWSPGGDREKMTLDEMRDLFSLDRINKTAGRFDREKLLAVNTDYAASSTPERLRAGFRDYAAVADSPLAGLDDATLDTVLRLCKGFRTFRDVDAKVGPLFSPTETIVYDPDAVAKVLDKKGGYAVLERLLPGLEAVADWSVEAIDGAIKTFCEQAGLKLGDAAQPLRVAITGRTVSPAIGESLALLGKPATLERVRRCLGQRG